jgi:hypothetical protein
MSNRHEEIDPNEDMVWELESKLEPGMLRFLAHVIEDGMQSGLRTQADFIRHFPPQEIMKGLTDRPDLRANILVSTTGLRSKIASRKSAESAGMDLQIALDEGETDAETIVSLFHPDDRVRYLDTSRLWSYIIEPRFWTCKKENAQDFARAKTHVAYILQRAIEDRLLTHRDIVDGITVGTIVQYVPLGELQKMIEKALDNSRSNKVYTEQDLLDAVPLLNMVQTIPLATIWDTVVSPKIANQNGLTGKTDANRPGISFEDSNEQMRDAA